MTAKITTRTFKASDVLNVEIINPQRGIDFLNWRVLARRSNHNGSLVGAGLYGVCYRRKLIYVGKFLGTQTDPFCGNVAISRWWAHFASLSMRGHRLSFPRATLASLIDAHEPALNPAIRRALIQTPPDISRDCGCITSVNRALFANRHWRRFGGAEPPNVLNDFSFVYARVCNGALELTIEQLRRAISKAEEEVIVRLRPAANNKIPWRVRPNQVCCRQAARIMSSALRLAVR